MALNINTGLSLVAIVYLLWLLHSHNMADFHAFLAYFHHLFNTAVTVTIKTGTLGVLNLPHMYIGQVVRYLFWPLCAPIYGRGWSKNDSFYG